MTTSSDPRPSGSTFTGNHASNAGAVGGLFAVIALNFTVNSTYQLLGTNDNPVARLFIEAAREVTKPLSKLN